MWMVRNFWYFFLVPGVLMLIVGFGLAFKQFSFRQKALRADGLVIGNRAYDDSDNGRTYRPEVEYTGSDGLRHTFVSGVVSSPPSFKQGDRVKVLYSPDRPDDVAIDTFFQQWFGTLMSGSLGAVFTSVGGIPLYLRVKREKLVEWLKLNGRPIQADFTGVRLQTNYEVNGRNPWRITAQWLNPATQQIQLFQTENLWFDPTACVTSKTLSVLIDPENPKRYWIDTSFLPQLAN